MAKKNVMIVGGNPDTGKRSKIIDMLHDAFLSDKTSIFHSVKLYNPKIPQNIATYNLIVWMPDITNEKDKNYPVKDKGAILICSKVMRPGYKEIDAISRIFRMNGNAVIAIYKDNSGKITFKLIDALGNIWCETSDIQDLYEKIIEIYKWTKGSIRKSLFQQPPESLPANSADIFAENKKNLEKFIEINNALANKVQTAVGKRFFGNLSTRCVKLFPTARNNDYIFISPRNVDKSKLTANDFIIIHLPKFTYYGNRKPSVDTPIQLFLYQKYPQINYMIHGHAYLKGFPCTENYFPCGDMREAEDILKVWGGIPTCINLKQHGFLIISKSLEEIEKITKQAEISA